MAARTAWNCQCKTKEGIPIVRPASRDRCLLCKMDAPWKDEIKERKY